MPEELTDEAGEIVWECSYQLWGKPIQEIVHREIQQNLRYQEQYLDRETGLHYNTFRYYDPDIGRFTQPDPIGLLGGINLYQYAPNALMWIDPWGLSCSPKNAKNKVSRGQGPKEIIRIDAPESSVPGSQYHAHGKNGGAINLDGSIHDRDPKFSRKTLEWLKGFGWNTGD